jgi:hypothetical protein
MGNFPVHLFEEIISSKCVEISGGNGAELFGKILLKDRLSLDSVSQLLIDPTRVTPNATGHRHKTIRSSDCKKTPSD